MSRMSRNRIKISLGTESANELDPTVDTTVDVTAEPGDVTETVMDETTQDSQETFDEIQEVEADAEANDELAEDVGALSDLAVAAEAAVATGKGFSRIEAASFNFALNSIVSKYTDSADGLVPAFESYESDTSGGNADEKNKEQTKQAGKGVVEATKTFFKELIKKIKQAWQAAKDLMRNIASRFKAHPQQLKALMNKLNETPEFNKVTVEYNTTNIQTSEDGTVDFDKVEEDFALMEKMADILTQVGRSNEEEAWLLKGLEAIKESDLSIFEQVVQSVNAYTATRYAKFNPKPDVENGEAKSTRLAGNRELVLVIGQPDTNKQLSTIVLRRAKSERMGTKPVEVRNKEMLLNLIDTAFSCLQKFQPLLQTNVQYHEFTKVLDKLGTDDIKLQHEAKIHGQAKVMQSIAAYVMSQMMVNAKLVDYINLLAGNVAEISALTIKKVAGDKAAKDKEDADFDKKNKKV